MFDYFLGTDFVEWPHYTLLQVILSEKSPFSDSIIW